MQFNLRPVRIFLLAISTMLISGLPAHAEEPQPAPRGPATLASPTAAPLLCQLLIEVRLLRLELLDQRILEQERIIARQERELSETHAEHREISERLDALYAQLDEMDLQIAREPLPGEGETSELESLRTHLHDARLTTAEEERRGLDHRADELGTSLAAARVKLDDLLAQAAVIDRHPGSPGEPGDALCPVP